MSIRRGVIATFLLRVLGAVASILTMLLLARFMGPSHYGAYAFAVSIVSLLSILVQIGFPTLLVREFARAETTTSWSELRGLFRQSQQIVVCGACVAVLVVLGLLQLPSLEFNSDDRQPLQIALLALPLIALGALRQAVLQGMKRPIAGQVVEAVVFPIALLLTVVWAASQTELTASLAAGAYVLAQALGLLVGVVLLARSLPSAFRLASPVLKTSAWIAAAAPLGITGLAYVLRSQSDIVMLRAMGTVEDVGVYKPAVAIAGLVTFGMTSVNAVVSPRISEFCSTGNTHALESVVRKSALTSGAMAALVALGIVVGGGTVLAFLGGSYESAYRPLLVLTAGQVANAVSGPVAQVLRMTGHERLALAITACFAGLNILMNWFLIPQFGVLGAASATALSLVGENFVMAYCISRRLGIRPSLLQWGGW